MSQARFRRSLRIVAMAGMIAGLALAGGCDQGNTEGGSDADGLGPQPVSDGGFGASLTITLDGGGEVIPTAGRVGFFVQALDPTGQPLAFRRVFCESEAGIAIIEPSSGGVAFEHTNDAGVMSGVLGGVTPGSFLLECRLEEGFNLVARRTLKVRGEVPSGFDGFPGAAGGNLGGGVIIDNPDGDAQLVSVTFSGAGLGAGDANGPIDITRDNDCDNDPDTNDPEPFTFDEYVLTIQNRTEEVITVQSVTFTVDDGRNVTSTDQTAGLVIAPGASGTVTGTFTEFSGISGNKTFAGTSFDVILGTYNVTFDVDAEAESGEDADVSGTASVTFGFVDNCGA